MRYRKWIPQGKSPMILSRYFKNSKCAPSSKFVAENDLNALARIKKKKIKRKYSQEGARYLQGNPNRSNNA
jgi:ribosome assembly protein YihI (activator of Der GTPase)